MTTHALPPFVRWMIVPAIVLAVMTFIGMALMLSDAFRVHTPGSLDLGGFTINNFERLTRPVYLSAFIDTLVYAAICAVFDLVLGYPLAYVLVRTRSRNLKTIILVLTLIPLFAGDLVRTYGWLVVLGKYGVVNAVLTGSGMTSEPMEFLYRPIGVVIAMVQYAMPVMVIILSASIAHIDTTLEKAAASLGASPVRRFLAVTLPLSVPGIVTGTMTIFAWCLSAFAIPQIIGGGRVPTIATLIYSVGYSNFNFPFAAALSLVALVLIGLFLAVGAASARLVQRRAAV